MDAQTAVQAGAFEADPDAIRNWHPLRVVRAALETELKIKISKRFKYYY